MCAHSTLLVFIAPTLPCTMFLKVSKKTVRRDIEDPSIFIYRFTYVPYTLMSGFKKPGIHASRTQSTCSYKRISRKVEDFSTPMIGWLLTRHSIFK